MTDNSLALPGDEVEEIELRQPKFETPATPHSAVADRISEDFTEQLDELDKVKGSNLSQLFQDCLKFQNETSMLRQNLAQMQVVLQSQLERWANTQGILDQKIKDLDPVDKDFASTMKQYMELVDTTTDMTLKITKVVRDLKKEIRLAEMGDRYHFHVSMVLTFMTGVTALLYKNLHSDPKLTKIVDGMKDLARMFQVRETTTVDSEDIEE